MLEKLIKVNNVKKFHNDMEFSAEEFNQHFIEIASSIINNLPATDISPDSFLSSISLPRNTSSFDMTTLIEVKKVIISLKNSSTKGCLWF